MKSTNKDQSSYLWKLSIITDVGLAHNAIHPWNNYIQRSLNGDLKETDFRVKQASGVAARCY